MHIHSCNRNCISNKPISLIQHVKKARKWFSRVFFWACDASDMPLCARYGDNRQLQALKYLKLPVLHHQQCSLLLLSGLYMNKDLQQNDQQMPTICFCTYQMNTYNLFPFNTDTCDWKNALSRIIQIFTNLHYSSFAQEEASASILLKKCNAHYQVIFFAITI